MITLRIFVVLVFLFLSGGNTANSFEENPTLSFGIRVFKEVTITGCFKGYGDYKNWVVFIIPRSAFSRRETLPPDATLQERRSIIERNLKTMKEERMAAFNRGHTKVHSDGTFRLILNNVESGDYILNYGEWTPDLSGMGGGRLKIESDVINMKCHERDI